MTTIQKIQARINELKNRKISEQERSAIGRAEEWLANGGYSRYSNEDFDVLNSLSCAE